MTRQDDVRNLIRLKYRRLQLLKEQQASFGSLNTPVHILIEIEDTEVEIQELQIELEQIAENPQTLDQRVKHQRQRITDGLVGLRQQVVEQSTKEKHISVVGHPPLGVVEYFKDRTREQAEAGNLLAKPTTRLVSIVGHGGMGKTALAIKVLHDLEQRQWPHTDDDIPLDGIIYLSTRTAGITLERLFLGCAKMLDSEQPNSIWTNPKLKTEDKILYLLEELKDGYYIILLDNLEDLLDDNGRLTDGDLQLFFDQSLTNAHGVRLLVTSRVALSFRREVMRFDNQVKLLEGLPVDDGVALLRELDPNNDYGLREASKEHLTQAVSLVHGVPRALEVIAGILANDPFSSLDEIMEKFYEQEDVVQTLVKENYKRLDSNARRVIEALAVFRKPVPSLAIDYLLEPFFPGLDVPDIIRRLIRTNIVSVDRSTKTVTLHPIDQDYVYSQLPDKGTDAGYNRKSLERRAADWYTQLRTLPETWHTIDDLEPQLAEYEHRIRAKDYDAAARVLEEIDFDYLFMWGYLTRLIELWNKVLGLVKDPQLQALCLGSLARVYRNSGQAQKSLLLNEQALEIVRDIGDRWWEGVWLIHLGSAYRDLGDIQQSIQIHRQALEITRQTENRRWEGIVLASLALSYLNLAHINQATEFYELSLAIAHEVNDTWGISYRLTNLGRAYHYLGRIQEATRTYEKALTISREIGNRVEEGRLIGNIGRTYHDLGEIEHAMKLYKEALIIARETSKRTEEHRELYHLAKANCDLGHFKESITFYKQALSVARETQDKWHESHYLLGLSRSLLFIEKLSDAQQYCLAAIELNVAEIKYESSLLLGILSLYQNDHKNAAQNFQDSVDLCMNILTKTERLYKPRYTLATALVGMAVCDSRWAEIDRRIDLLSPAMTEYHRGLEITVAAGIINNVICNLELIRAAGVVGLESVFDLLNS